MKIQELVNKINDKNFDLEKELQVKKYLPIGLKKSIAQIIIFECIEEEDGVIKIDSVQQYMSYVRHMIVSHTNLEYRDEDYDILCSTEYESKNILNIIMGYFENDAIECTRILDLMIKDYMQTISIENAIAGFLYKINLTIDSIKDKTTEANFSELLQNLDIDKLSNFLNMYIK